MVNTRKIILTRGLSGSGKSTWARQFVKEPGWTRVNMDEIREMLGFRYSRESEALALEIQDAAIFCALYHGYNVVVDNTHLHDAWPRRYVRFVRQWVVEWEIKDFTHVPVLECIARDAQRSFPLGAEVIRSQFATLEREQQKGLWTAESILVK